ncbi:MAG: penicillin-binding protein 2 [Planctomycetota bacterium]|jgi:cell division protein FtsI (penicillin-binding protein 3)|nr:penicillin-binding protein 2 [Planctomycetota bacterium]
MATNSARRAGDSPPLALKGLIILFATFSVLFLALAARLVDLQVFRHQEMLQVAVNQVYGMVREEDRRGRIVDARGRTLAVSVDAKSVALDPKTLLRNPEAKPHRLIARLRDLLSLSDKETARLEQALDKRRPVAGREGEEEPISFVWVKRRLSREEWEKLSTAMAEAKSEASAAWKNRRQCLRKASYLHQTGEREEEDKAKELAQGWKRAAQEWEGYFAGVFFPPEYARTYPQGELASHILGFGNIDGQGLEGVEKMLDPLLRGIPVERLVARDARSRALSSLTRDERSSEGMQVKLTIDSAIQSIVEDELFRVVAGLKTEYPAVVAHAVVMDPWTGDILALANYPTFDANHPGDFDPRNRRNDAVAAVQEPGSTFKPLLVAASLEEGLADLADSWDCSTFQMENGRVIKDIHPYGQMTLGLGLIKSSNPAMVRLGLRLGPQRMREYVLRYGFGEKSGSLLPGEVRGRVTSAENWSSFTMGSVPMGYEINVTSIQMASAYSAIANGGLLPRPNFIKAVYDNQGALALEVGTKMRRRVISEKTSRIMRETLRKVVTEGTGRRANIPEYALGGKTGTANMIVNAEEKKQGQSGYSKKRHTANFVALAPWDKPRMVICVSVRDTGKFGGEAASPVGAAIARRALSYLGLPTEDGSVPDSSYVEVPEVFEKIIAPPAEYTVGTEDDDNFLGEEVDPRIFEEWQEDPTALG